MMKAEAIGRPGDVPKYFKHSEGTASGICRILSMREPSLPIPRSPQGRRSSGITLRKFLKSAALQSPSKYCRAITGHQKKVRHVNESVE